MMTAYYDTLFAYIARILELPENDKISCRDTFHPISVPKDTLLETAGKAFIS